MERIEDEPEVKFMAALFGKRVEGKGPDYYPYVVVEEGGEERRIELREAIQEALTTISPRNKKALELRFGLLDGKPRTFREVGRELSRLTGSRAHQIVAKALRELRHPRRSKILRRFFVLSPEEINNLTKTINRLSDENRSLDENNQRLKKILKGCDVTKEEMEGINSENLAPAAESLKRDREALKALILKFPHPSFWPSIRRKGITELSKLKKLVENGEIRELRGIGKGAEKFFKEILQKTEKEASP